ncbi:MAG: alpha-E domain-containing protein, partial [Propionibacteriaceae bacterium]|nr:alpha-E domain-containing protein [Propionibacteriaceae bacterium]
MLSRIAESLFWIGRYLERAEDTCRIVEVHLQLLLEDPSVNQEEAAATLLTVMGSPVVETPDTNEVLRALCYDEDSPCSIASALGGAREAARRARETVSIEMWEAINTTWNSVKGGRLPRMRPASAFKHVRERCAVISGTADQTMSHDEGWHFLTLGRSVERVDMTARMISTAAVSSGQSAWNNVLRGCGADHAFIRTYGGVTTDRDAAEFLLLDRLFPRSLVYTLHA